MNDLNPGARTQAEVWGWLEADDANLLAACQTTRTRRQGPGGQHRNKVSTAVVVEHRPSGLRAEAAERRSQVENLRQALARLRVKIALTIRTSAAEAPFEPSQRWQQRCVKGRLSVSVNHPDYVCLLSEALDALAFHGWRPAGAARQLGCSTSQLVRLVQQQPAAWELINRQRSVRGLKALQ